MSTAVEQIFVLVGDSGSLVRSVMDQTEAEQRNEYLEQTGSTARWAPKELVNQRT